VVKGGKGSEGWLAARRGRQFNRPFAAASATIQTDANPTKQPQPAQACV